MLAGSGTLRVRDEAGSGVRELRFRANSTLVVQPDYVHQARRGARIALLARLLTWQASQVVNTGEELLQLTVVISRPPIRVFVYDDWATPDAAAVARVPYQFDTDCGADAAALPRSGDEL